MDRANLAGGNDPDEERYFDYLFTAEKMHNARAIGAVAGFLPAIPAAYFVWAKAKNKAWWVAWGAAFLGLGWLVRQSFDQNVARISQDKPGFAEFYQEWLSQGDKQALRQGAGSSAALRAIVAGSFASAEEGEKIALTGLEEGEPKAARKVWLKLGKRTEVQKEAPVVIESKPTPGFFGMMVCPNCKMKVIPKANGTCPSCGEHLL